MGISKFNKGSNVDWNIKTEDWEIKKIKDLEPGREYTLKGFFPTKEGKFGAGALLISDGYLVGIPNRYHDQILEMLQDEEVVELVKAGKCAFSYRMVPTDKGNDAVVIDFIDK